MKYLPLLILILIPLALYFRSDETLGGEVTQSEAISYLTTTDRRYLQDLAREQNLKLRYIQVIDGQAVYRGETLDITLPSYMDTDIYDGPEGTGFALIVTYPERTISIGHGAYSANNTWVLETPLPIASTTP